LKEEGKKEEKGKREYRGRARGREGENYGAEVPGVARGIKKNGKI